MSYKIDFAAADVQWQILALQEFSEIANRNFYPAMNRSVRITHASVASKMKFDDLSGQTRATFGKRASGKGLMISGRVGWFGKGAVHTANLLEYGVSPHKIGSGMHPGYPAMKFMEDGYTAVESTVESEMEMAMINTVNDLVKK